MCVIKCILLKILKSVRIQLQGLPHIRKAIRKCRKKDFIPSKPFSYCLQCPWLSLYSVPETEYRSKSCTAVSLMSSFLRHCRQKTHFWFIHKETCITLCVELFQASGKMRTRWRKWNISKEHINRILWLFLRKGECSIIPVGDKQLAGQRGNRPHQWPLWTLDWFEGFVIYVVNKLKW